MSELKQKHRKLGLVNANHAFKEYIAIAKLEFIIYVYDSIDEALEDMNKETKSCPYFKTLDKNMKTGKCIINKKKPVVPGRIDRKFYCLQSSFSICPLYKEKHKKPKKKIKP